MVSNEGTVKRDVQVDFFSTEPQLTRALGAEIRNDPAAATSFLEQILGLSQGELGSLTAVYCEAEERIDIMVHFCSNDVPFRVGIEGKIGHIGSREQLLRESDICDYLVLLVLEEEDAGDVAQYVHAVVSWREFLDEFDQPRITTQDVEGIPAPKVVVERRLRKLVRRLRQEYPEGWYLEVSRHGSGMPHIDIVSPELSDGIQLRGQIQQAGWGGPKSINDVTFHYRVAVGVKEDDQCYPSIDATAPPWVEPLRILVSQVNGRTKQLAISTSAGGGGGKSLFKEARRDLTEKYFPNHKWVVKGFTNYSLGVLSKSFSLEQLDEAGEVSKQLFLHWYQALEEQRLNRPQEEY